VVQLDAVAERAIPGDFARESVDRVALLAAVGELPIQMRAAVVLRYYADLPVEAIAQALDKSPNTIKAQLQTALDHLRLALNEPAANTTEISHA